MTGKQPSSLLYEISREIFHGEVALCLTSRKWTKVQRECTVCEGSMHNELLLPPVSSQMHSKLAQLSQKKPRRC
jgi:hypothetical protein